ncbi:uncharacterized protein G2W53_022599 [Senna tora]|uniref:Uncharacterized protein n=1 Tax=Senna tora TaxID=362788 RepID=A0A834TPY0_9FABA|nr:uncharacterized protein G2W53_022599 [Senna tora]
MTRPSPTNYEILANNVTKALALKFFICCIREKALTPLLKLGNYLPTPNQWYPPCVLVIGLPSPKL